MTRVLALMINFVAYLIFFVAEPVESSYFVSVFGEFFFLLVYCFVFLTLQVFYFFGFSCYFVIMRTTVTISNLVQKAAESAKERERERGKGKSCSGSGSSRVSLLIWKFGRQFLKQFMSWSLLMKPLSLVLRQGRAWIQTHQAFA